MVKNIFRLDPQIWVRFFVRSFLQGESLGVAAYPKKKQVILRAKRKEIFMFQPSIFGGVCCEFSGRVDATWKLFLAGWWFQPLWKYARQNGFIFPNLGVKIPEIFELHHPVSFGGDIFRLQSEVMMQFFSDSNGSLETSWIPVVWNRFRPEDGYFLGKLCNPWYMLLYKYYICICIYVYIYIYIKLTCHKAHTRHKPPHYPFGCFFTHACQDLIYVRKHQLRRSKCFGTYKLKFSSSLGQDPPFPPRAMHGWQRTEPGLTLGILKVLNQFIISPFEIQVVGTQHQGDTFPNHHWWYLAEIFRM